MQTPAQRYKNLIAEGMLSPDPAQELIMEKLDTLSSQLNQWDKYRHRNFWQKLLNHSAPPPPSGLYLWGGVGRGKTLLMDLFFNNTQFTPKRRIHFHEFMIEVHQGLNAWRSMPENERKKQPEYMSGIGDDPIPPVARAIAAKSTLLCFDEFQVSDIADAMILGRLFEALFKEGIVVVSTSNRHPNDLYKDGLNRQLFLPFIDMFQAKSETIELQSAQDYRLERLSGAPVYYTPLGAPSNTAMDNAWHHMMAGANAKPETLTINNRTIHIPLTARGSARFSFADLCEKPLGAADYLAIARRYGTIFIDNIPVLTPENRNEAKRFVTLIDALYDFRCKLICSADALPEKLYPVGDGVFEFERTSSRLIEMQSKDYLSKEHCPEKATE